MFLGYLRDNNVQPTTVREDRINKGLGQIKAAPRSPKHPFNQFTHLIGNQNDSGQFTSPTSSYEDATWFIDPNFFNRWVIEKLL
jgi:hypothetical protein